MEKPGMTEEFMRRPIRKHLTVSDCRALAESREGSYSLTEPFNQRRTSRDLNRGLYPRHRTQRLRRGQGRQQTITDYFQARGRGSQSSGDAGQPKALKTEVMDTVADNDELVCMAMSERGAPLGLSPTVSSGKRPFDSRGIDNENSTVCRGGVSAKRPIVANNSKLFSESSVIKGGQNPYHGEQSNRNKAMNYSTEFDPFKVSAEEDEMFYRAVDNLSERLGDEANVDHSVCGVLQNPALRGHTGQMIRQHTHSKDRRSPLVATFCLPPSELWKAQEQPNDVTLEPIPDACFGLLGTSFSKPNSQGHLIQLPDEVLMTIFGFLPVMELYQNVSLVCHHWRNLVDDPLFIPWKKCYYKYIKHEETTVEMVNGMLLKYRICEEEELCVLNFIRCAATIKYLRRMNPEAILTCLKNHTLYTKAEACIIKMLPDQTTASGTVDVWAVIAAIVLLSDGVADVQKLMCCLIKPNSTISIADVTDALYRMATLLYAMREKGINISNRIHYSIFYCLNQFENSNSVSGTTESKILSYQGDAWARNRSDIKLTHEQRQILNHDIAPGQVVKIMAFAGTGKTSTLVKYAERRPHMKFLYATFNKSISGQASRLFPSNVECRTFHSIAYRHVGQLYAQKKKLNSTKLTPFIVNHVLPEKKGGFIRAKMVAQTIEAFFASADNTISTEHAPLWCKDTHGRKVLVEHEERKFVVREAEKIWHQMKLPFETRIEAHKMTHDGYLKEWQLSKPKLKPYDAIFVDEAQDCTPAIMDVVVSQSCGTILVGDPHQQIYTFRGAVNALFEVQHSHIFYLTQSFRFGAEIAYVGATILDVTKNLRSKSLVGGNQTGTINGVRESQTALLSRTNSCVFTEAVRVTEGERPARIHLIGGPQSFGLDRIRDIWILLQPEEERIKKCLQIKDSFIRMWSKKENGFASLKKYATASEDKELEGKIAVVEKFNIRIPELVSRLYNCHTSDPTFSDYILGTVHKAKGMEFDTVQVTDDFVKVTGPKHILDRSPFRIDSVPEDEWNLLYVAVTRAKKHLIMTKSIENILTYAGEYLLRAELTIDALKEENLICSVGTCSNTVQADTVLTLKKLPMTYSDTQRDEGGYLCPTCVVQRVGPYAFLAADPALVHSMEYTIENVELPHHIRVLMQMI
ncbi:F-box DNA helicase 1 [Ambystoma mexicanum]|uniref:F-box DNA helicase 1 n=1 Tax=Ambystoma mexicanum TaxID=8296 RepID=UPI0037E8934D